MSWSPAERRIVRAFTLAGKTAEMITSELLQQLASRMPPVGRSLKNGNPGRLWKTGKFMSGVGLGLFLTTRNKIDIGRWASSVMITAGALAMRYALFKAGKTSAGDPQALFRQQRAAGPPDLECFSPV
jgi:hypothetical protein